MPRKPQKSSGIYKISDFRSMSAEKWSHHWNRSTCCDRHLTPDQVAHAHRLGVPTRRYAWLLTCPKGGYKAA